MKRVLLSLPVKVAVFFLTSVFLLTFLASGVLTVILEAYQFYDYSKDDLKQELVSRRIADECYTSFRGAYYGHAVANDPNFRYTVVDKEGIKVSGTAEEPTLYTATYYYYEWKETGLDSYRNPYSYYDSAFTQEEHFRELTPLYTVTGGYVSRNPVNSGNMYLTLKAIDLFHGWREVFPIVTIAALFLTVAGGICLCIVAGRTAKQEEPVLCGLNRIPFDLFFVLTAGGEVGIVLLGWLILESERLGVWLFGLPLLGWMASSLLLGLVFSLAARVKVGKLLNKTLLGKLCILLFSGLKAGWGKLSVLLHKIPTVPTVAVFTGFFALCNILLGFLTREPLAFLLLTLEWVLGFFGAVAVAVAFTSLQKQAKSIAEGNLEEKIDTKYLAGPLKEHGEQLNRISDGLNTAVNERTNSERMKTELITNVSHDIKTPLTSIINYVDLLSKEPELPETAQEYLLVLQRQSARLKKLTDDIVEASKASSGALIIHPSPCDLGVLLEQTAGEYQEKTADCNLTVLLSKPEEPVTVFADGQRLWRVFDNLMNNICKYALPGTRVYLDLTETPEQAVVTFRNISKDPLNIRPEELTERFVRGDQSRNSEGSGLGLAIARSLVELQHGTFDITIDADLFKITVTFPRWTEPH